jgi:phosphonate transport system ATP-binding protein
MSAPRIQLAKLTRRWNTRTALQGLDLDVAAGQRVALIGPSGSGKTTLVRLIRGALSPSSGKVCIDGRAIAAMNPRDLRTHRRRCGVVDQHSTLIPQITVHGNVIAGLLPSWPWYRTALSALWPIERARVKALLDEVGLADRQWDRAGVLSGGQKQRVAIARAIAGSPTMLIGDEPTAALDPTTAREVIELLAAEARQRHATLILSTHRISQVIDHVDRVVGLRAGRLFLDEPAGRLTDDALNELYAGSRERL